MNPAYSYGQPADDAQRAALYEIQAQCFSATPEAIGESVQKTGDENVRLVRAGDQVLGGLMHGIGIERANAFCRYADDRLRRRGIEHARMLHADAVEFLHFWCADAVADVVHLYFSDPWPKARHFKRRVIQDRSLDDLHRVLLK